MKTPLGPKNQKVFKRSLCFNSFQSNIYRIMNLARFSFLTWTLNLFEKVQGCSLELNEQSTISIFPDWLWMNEWIKNQKVLNALQSTIFRIVNLACFSYMKCIKKIRRFNECSLKFELNYSWIGTKNQKYN